jgi:hypothetical protein
VLVKLPALMIVFAITAEDQPKPFPRDQKHPQNYREHSADFSRRKLLDVFQKKR